MLNGIRSSKFYVIRNEKIMDFVKNFSIFLNFLNKTVLCDELARIFISGFKGISRKNPRRRSNGKNKTEQFKPPSTLSIP